MLEAAATHNQQVGEPKSRYIAAMSAALSLAEGIRRLAEAGLESASRDWEGEQLLASEIASSIGENAGRLIAISTIGAATKATKVALAA